VTALERLRLTNRDAWLAPLALGTLMLALQAANIASLRYERDAILRGGEVWRLVTGHLVHADAAHLAWNLAGLALVAWLFVREYSRRDWLVILVASTAAVDLGFLALEPHLEWYVGFSGVLHGLMAGGLLAWLVRYRDAVTALVAVLFVAKLGWEHLVGPLPFTAQTLSLPVIHSAHTYGAIGGFLAAAVCLRRRRPASPL
jgi:rhomboid family GlyGly-CTERM serine protease